MFDGVLYVMHLVSNDGDWQSGDKHSEAGRWVGLISKYIKVHEELKKKTGCRNSQEDMRA